ncbi:MAG: hypothetical protein DRP42_03250 [Tenericutes bacterium]|nr:MAG: hypothetical protein DRP42_03250 [Mycoplasmatota bacterium]
MARLGEVGHGPARRGRARQGYHAHCIILLNRNKGKARLCKARQGLAWLSGAEHSKARRGEVGQGKVIMLTISRSLMGARHGMAGQGEAWQGPARQGSARQGYHTHCFTLLT